MPRGWKWGKKRKSGYRSGAEEKIAEYLTEKHIGFEYESLTLQYSKKIRQGMCTDCSSTEVVQQLKYTPDFILTNGNVIEYKGRLTSKDRSKLIAVKKANPDVNLKLLFGSNNKLQKNKEKRYADWAIDNGFDYEIGLYPPERWLQLGSTGWAGTGPSQSTELSSNES